MNRSSAAIGLVSLSCLLAGPWVSRGYAYDDFAHRQIVKDAFNYIVAKANDRTPYFEGVDGTTDFALAKTILASGGDTSKAKGRIRETADELGGYAVKTDEQPDVVLDLPRLGPQPSFSGLGSRYFFTVFSHFVNVRRPGKLWEIAGYNYLWVENNQRCVNPSNEDRFGICS